MTQESREHNNDIYYTSIFKYYIDIDRLTLELLENVVPNSNSKMKETKIMFWSLQQSNIFNLVSLIFRRLRIRK